MWTKLRIWWWKKRYAWRIWERAIGPDGESLDRTFCDTAAEAGWGASVYFADRDWEKALESDPIEEADEEMSNWTNDEEST